MQYVLSAEIKKKLCIVNSTQKNIPTMMTGIGNTYEPNIFL